MGQEPFSYANLSNLNALEDLYQQYLQNPESVAESWRYFFEGMQLASSRLPQMPETKRGSADLRVYLLIDAYRKFGHLMARCNPIATAAPTLPAELNLQRLGFSSEELEVPFPTCGFLPEPSALLKEIVAALTKTYCGTIGVEYMGLGAPEIEEWLQGQIEPFFPLKMGKEDKLSILHRLNQAEVFESFLHTKYVGQKRFSLEGGETLIPMLAALLEHGAELGVQEVVLGMAHRGRLNVLANILNKSYAHIFHEFEDFYTPDQSEGSGDVKYHKGFVGEMPTRSGKVVKVTLVANPSHLETVVPIVEGMTRARQELHKGPESVPLLIHGDAAIAGQGVVYETLQLSRLNGYGTGGTVHLVINNQIGFTTLPKDGRSTPYCTEIARSFRAPIFHVNAEDPEGCVRVAHLAIEIRQRFHCDVFIDLNCYRKYGHNEGDEPTFTQPLEYSLIKLKRPIRLIFREQLIQEKVITPALAEELEQAFKTTLQQALESVPRLQETKPPEEPPAHRELALNRVATCVPAQALQELAQRLSFIPPDLKCHPKVQRLLQERVAMLAADPTSATIDWGMGETLAYATLLQEGIHIRLSGQDVRRGTFSHRHAIWVDQVKELKYFPLSHLSPTQASFDVFNSPLSEYAVLGFDFGYSVAYPNSLVIWEAQYGDFANGAQIIIDQCISSSEQKWNLCSNLVLLLPHGYEGQGPEHSSARIERFLQLAGHDNTRIANVTTPAQLFHLLRAQALHPEKKPLILFTPKAMLRHPLCVSSLNQFTAGAFHEVLDDPAPPATSRRLLLCSGRIFYDLLEERKKRGASDIALVRIEQLYPFPRAPLQELFKSYPEAECFWVQEEHQNMGPWSYLAPYLKELLQPRKLTYAGRERSAATATGSRALHQKQYEAVMNQAFQGEL